MANGSAAKDVSKDVSTAPLPPFVFQCRACRQVVGESTNLDCSVRSLACVALTGASGLAVDPHPQATVLPSDAGTSGKKGEDEDNSSSAKAVAFVSLSCSGCGATLGKRFGERGLPPRLERIAGLFCLEVESISSYELGKPEMVAAVVSAGKREAAAAAAAAASTDAAAAATPNSGDALALSSLLSRVAELEEELVKVQNVVLGHNEALARLQEQRR